LARPYTFITATKSSFVHLSRKIDVAKDSSEPNIPGHQKKQQQQQRKQQLEEQQQP
jgi:hypothetical protein